MASTPTVHRDALDSREGWVIVGLSFSLLLVLWGAVFTFTVYSDALASTFGLTSIRTSAVFSIGTAAFFLAGGSVGILVSRLSMRLVALAAGVGIAASVGALQFVSSFVGVAAAFALFGVAGGTTFVVIISLVPQWFDAYEGRAMGVAMTGNGLGIQLLPFVWLWLLSRTTIRVSFLLVGGAGALLLFVAAFVFRRPPGARTAGAPTVDLAWLRSLLADRRFLAAWVGLVLSWAWYFVLSAGMVDILTSAGIARSIAATAFGLVGGVSIASRVASGGLADRLGPRQTLAAGVGLTAVGLFVLAVAATVPTMYVALVTFGAGLGAIATLYAPIVIRAFGPENATAVAGVFTFWSAVSGFTAPVAVDALAGAAGGYAVPLTVLGALTLVGAGLFYWGTDPAV